MRYIRKLSFDGKFEDWIYFLANVFTPNTEYSSEDDESLILNAVKYFRRVRHNRYELFDEKLSTKKSVPETSGGKKRRKSMLSY